MTKLPLGLRTDFSDVTLASENTYSEDFTDVTLPDGEANGDDVIGGYDWG